MDTVTLLRQSEPFLNYATEWEAALPTLALSSVAADPAHVAIIAVDVINGFCHAGPLASPRVKNIIAPIVSLMEGAYRAGVRQFVLPQDTHAPDAVEFGQFPPHCVRGTVEAETVPEIKALPFYSQMAVLPKNSISSSLSGDFEPWLQAHPQVDTFIVVGDCTDLCTYQLAMHLRLRANAAQLKHRVLVPAEAVDTYDLPVEAAQAIGAVPHPADLLHLIFLYSLRLNGVEVVRSIR
jgi:nicotinamidase-related amidase